MKTDNYLMLYEFFIKNERLIVFLFATILGTTARGVFESVTSVVTKLGFFRNLLAALFINYILQAIMVNEGWLLKYYGPVLALGSYLCYQVLIWVDKALLKKVLKKTGLEE